MATLGSTNVTQLISINGEQPLTYGEGGLLLESFRVTGGTVGDTIALTPTWISKIFTIQNGIPASNNVSTSGSTNVTLTLTASAATTVFFDVWLLGRR